MTTLPVGRYEGKELDPNATPFLLSIGYKEEVATRFGSCKSDMTFSKTGENEYVLNISQPPINRSQDIPFTLGDEKTTTMPSGKTMKSLFDWIPAENKLDCTYSNSDGVSWRIVYQFRVDGVSMIRDSATVHTFSDFQRV
ncbi:hypothetical protein BV898_00587 [Hypsibius exemplaris]|uniref:Uncharacterized protein n=1 Tax=Hypsibius exemplaris TaxID=2072580 RepID=A0A1W0XE56_HYPEX|nr:hypothetical protein BV898_00587 [Hypsibius exemplaris]